MIEKLKEHDIIDPKTDKVIGKIGCDLREIMDKLNEVIDWINDVSALRVTDKQVTANLPNIDAGELAFLSKENTELKDELERTRKALDVAKDAIRHTDWFFDGDYNVDSKTMHNEIRCAIKAITALEQKDVK